MSSVAEMSDDRRLRNLLIEFGYEPFLLFAYKDREKVVVKHCRDDLDEGLIGLMFEEYGFWSPEDVDEW